MPVSSVSSADSMNYVSSSGSESQTGMTVDTGTFLKLLCAQLKYQDPLDPQSDTEFVSELAQMSSLEQMQKMNTALSGSQACDMLGKYVYAEILDKNTGLTNCYFGLIESILYKNGEPCVQIGDTAISVSDVMEVYDKSAFETGDTPETGDTDAPETI